MAPQGSLSFQAWEKPMSRAPEKHPEADLEGPNDITESVEGPFLKKTNPSIDGGKPGYVKDMGMWRKRPQSGSQGSDDLTELTENPFKGLSRPSTDRVPSRFLKDLWKKQSEASSEGSDNVLKSIEDPFQKYAHHSDDKSQTGYRKYLWSSAPRDQHRFALGPGIDVIRRKESAVIQPSPLASETSLKTSFPCRRLSIGDGESKVPKMSASQDQHRFVLESGIGVGGNEGSAFSATRSAGSNTSLKMDSQYKRPYAELGDSGVRKAVKFRRWASPFESSKESQTKLSWDCDSMIVGESPNIMRSIESEDDSSSPFASQTSLRTSSPYRHLSAGKEKYEARMASNPRIQDKIDLRTTSLKPGSSTLENGVGRVPRPGTTCPSSPSQGILSSQKIPSLCHGPSAVDRGNVKSRFVDLEGMSTSNNERSRNGMAPLDREQIASKYGGDVPSFHQGINAVKASQSSAVLGRWSFCNKKDCVESAYPHRHTSLSIHSNLNSRKEPLRKESEPKLDESDKTGHLGFGHLPSIIYYDEPEFLEDEAEQSISTAPRIQSKRQQNSKGKKTERKSSQSPIDISDDDRQLGAPTTSISKRARNEFEMTAQTNIESTKRARQDSRVINLTEEKPASRDKEVINLTEEEIEQGIEAALDDADEVAATSSLYQRTEIRYRNAPVELPFQELGTYGHSRGRIKRGWTYELLNGTFLLVRKIVIDLRTDAVVIRGLQLKRAKDLHGYLPPKLNEVVFMLDIDKDDARPAVEQAVIEVSVAQIVKRRLLVITNVPFPEYQFNHDDWNNSPDVAANANLVARWKFVRVFADAQDRLVSSGGTKVDQMCQKIWENEFEDMISMCNKQLRYNWRGETILGGAYRPTLDPVEESGIYYYHDPELQKDFLPANGRRPPRTLPKAAPENDDEEFESYNPTLLDDVVPINLVSDEYPTKKKFVLIDSDEEMPQRTSSTSTNTNKTVTREDGKTSSERYEAVVDLSEESPTKVTVKKATLPPKTKRLPGQTYKYADGFCGCGGTTAGAHKAGLRVTIGFDMWDHAGASWKANFPDSTLYLMSANEIFHYVKKYGHNVTVDILHLSPPCQFFSPAHTVEGQNDEANVAAFLCIEEAVTAFKPRIVTLEETAGLAIPYHGCWLSKLINMFTSKGYSIRWKVCELFKWGLCQPRKRLVVIAACPGESMPEFPDYTHNKDGSNGLKPYTTVGDVLSSILPGAEDHDPDTVGMAGPAAVGCLQDEMLPRTIVCHGGGNCHPSGRKLTLREYARFQGFSNDHKFRGSCILKQIGNAVPSIVAEVLFNSIRKHLEAEDGIEDEREVIELDGPDVDGEVVAIGHGAKGRNEEKPTVGEERRRSKKAGSIITID